MSDESDAAGLAYNVANPESWGRAWMSDPEGGGLGALWQDLVTTFRGRARLAEPAPLFTGELLDGGKFDLASFRDQKSVLIVFGSITCPPCVSNIAAAKQNLRSLYAEYSARIEFCYVYTREGHPGPKLGHQRSIDEKRANARRLRDMEQIPFPVVVDSFDGAIHRQYADPRFNNPVFLVGRNGLITYKSAWLDASELPQVLADQVLWDERATLDRTIKKSFSERIRALREPFDSDGNKKIQELMKLVGLDQGQLGPVPGIGTARVGS